MPEVREAEPPRNPSLGWFNRRRLEESFAISTALLVLVVIVSVMAVVHSGVSGELHHGLQDRGRELVRSVAVASVPGLKQSDPESLSEAAGAAFHGDGVLYVQIRGADGKVLQQLGEVPAEGATAAPARAADIVTRELALEPSGLRTPRVHDVTGPILDRGGEKVLGSVRLGLSHELIAAELRRIDLGLAMVGLALAAAAVGGGRWLARWITAPLRRLAQGTQALAAGDMAYRIPVSGARETADLARAFNKMMDRIQEKDRESQAFQRAIKALNATLEEQVRERTRALAESEAQYKTLVEHSPDVILIVQGGRLQFVNRAFVEIFGLSEEQALRSDFRFDEIFDAWSATLASSRIEGWEKGEPPSPMELVGRDTRGNVRDLELRGSCIEYRGKPAAECLLIDLTETKRLRERLGETEKLRALGELASGVAHDFNNLLGAVLGRVQLLRKKEFDAATMQHLAVIERAAQDGRETVRRIQEFSRTRRDTEFAPVHLGEVMKDAVEITKTRWKGDAERKQVSLQVTLDAPAVPPVMGNGAELREVFTNLILNAVDAMPQGGKLHLSCWEDCNKVLAEVRDTGVGMSEDTRRHLFDPFFTTKGPSGNGLGLSVVYGIVTRHAGRIDVASAPGTGTTFLLEFPSVKGAMAVAGGDGAAMPTKLLRVGRILVIDDESDIAEVVRDALSAEGHLVETAHTGTDGVRLAAAMNFDLVFTDLGMPDMTGWEVAERIRSGHPDLPVVLVTGWGASLDKSEVKRRGISAVVHKPFEIAEILRTTANMLGAKN